MYNNDALTYSEQVLPAQIDFLLGTKPYIDTIVKSGKENESVPKADYIFGIDATANCNDGTSKSIQFKHRKDDNGDFVLIGRKLTGAAVMNSAIGFTYLGNRYTLIPQADIYIETIQDKHICVTREEINSIEAGLSNYSDAREFVTIQPKYLYADDGSTFANGEYYVFIKLDMLARMLEGIFKHQNPHLFPSS